MVRESVSYLEEKCSLTHMGNFFIFFDKLLYDRIMTASKYQLYIAYSLVDTTVEYLDLM